jgi:hypothetical protein
MAKLRYLVSLITKDNDYQMGQAASAKTGHPYTAHYALGNPSGCALSGSS